MAHFERKPGATILVAPLVRLRFGARFSSQTALMYETSSHLVDFIRGITATTQTVSKLLRTKNQELRTKKLEVFYHG